ncbi:class I SAM-dependent DNA methyltransferase [Kocuria flava]|uniref:class I SAM-dependent DNA methyltransferase n=1 Tax=Kocuria flava TaxID=446860 RepID=UPI001FF4FA1F|nr:DNA methyltransferase [Kocuria flava]MCJ8503490.1 class I SAM-dependent DNA methyltransferase [Kocuria flava]
MSTILDLVDGHEFTKLFVEELGWDRPDAHKTWTPPTAGEGYTLTQVASFSGLRVWHCPTLPSRSVQRGIDNELSKANAERLVIFSDGTHQEWRWPRHRQLGGVNAKLMVHPHTVGEPDQNLESRLKAIELGIDDDVTLTQLLTRMRVAFDVESETASQQAARLMGTLYEHLNTAGMEPTQATLLLSRLLFLFFGDDTGMWRPNAFRDWIAEYVTADEVSTKLGELFGVLDDPQADNGTANAKPWTLDEQYEGFRYVNGSLFAETLNIPPLDATFRGELLEACKFDWSVISPAVFGSMFQTVKDAKARRELGEHYTTETNIQRLIRPLFLDELEERLDRAWDNKAELTKLHNHLGDLRFMDPACGCGNFLVVTYRELRALELRLLKRREELDVLDSRRSGQNRAQSAIHLEGATEVKVSLDHFYGIELEDWPARIAQTAMLLVDHQANQTMAEEFGTAPAKLPIKVSAAIMQGNALRTEWKDLLPSSVNVFIFGNPPFLGHATRNDEQAGDLRHVWRRKDIGRLDYVTGWYAKVLDYFRDVNGGRWAFVSTNSIVQGEPVPALFGPVFAAGWRIRFAHRTFAWASEAPSAAAVHCVIIGFDKNIKSFGRLFSYLDLRGVPDQQPAKFINGYLVDGPNVLVEQRRAPLAPGLPPATFGNMPRDGGHLVVAPEEYEEVVRDPVASEYLRLFIGARELVRAEERWCLWLVDLDPADVKRSPVLRERLESVRTFRMASTAASTRTMAMTPHLFGQRSQPDTDYVCLPRVVSERRPYFTVAHLPSTTIVSDAVFKAEDPDGYLFAVASSSMFLTWQKTVGGRLKSDIRFSNTLVWNNLPLPAVEKAIRQEIIEAGRGVLAARDFHPEYSLAEHYKLHGMDPQLKKAHDELDAVVDRAFGAKRTCTSEKQRQEVLFARYAEMTAH